MVDHSALACQSDAVCSFLLKGLSLGDEIIEFGSVNTGNFQNLQNIASVVQHSEGVWCLLRLNF